MSDDPAVEITVKSIPIDYPPEIQAAIDRVNAYVGALPPLAREAFIRSEERVTSLLLYGDDPGPLYGGSPTS